jgi:hypothetical protein
MSRFNDIREMNKYELKSFIRSHRGVNVSIMSGDYSDEQRLLSSKVLYAKNRLRLLAVNL